MVQTHFAEYYGIDAGQVRVIPNAIDPGRFQERDRLRLRAELRKKHGLAPDDVVGLFVGHNYHLKGLEPLLYAVRELPPGPFKLLVCGGAKFGRYQRLAERLGVTGQVRFLGYCPEVRGCFFASDLLVHPTFYDPCSLVVLEALACGLPVITSRSNGAAELLHAPADGTVLDDPHDSQALARHIEQWCDPARRAAGSKAARQAAAAWTFEDHYQALLQVFREAARRKQAA
jgi:UDP-glucose:(heptosyl)LPS alpha-1,3-glucosyltransferase